MKKEAIKVYKYRNSELLAEYSSIRAAAKANNIPVRSLASWMHGKSKHAPAYSTENIVYSFNKIDYSKSLQTLEKMYDILGKMYAKEIEHSETMFEKACELATKINFLNSRNIWQRIINKQYEK